jgi:hypothetical protein
MVEVSAENISLVTIVTFLGVFFILVASMPSGLIMSNAMQQGRIVSVPTYFESIEIQSFAGTYLVNATEWGNPQVWTFTLGGWNMGFEVWNYYHVIRAYTYSSWWIFKWDYKDFEWHDCQGVTQSSVHSGLLLWGTFLDWEKLDDAYAEDSKSGLRWTIKNDVTQLFVFLGFNQTKYAKPSDAILSNDMYFLFCINFDKVNTSFNAWNIIGAILFFQMPNVHPAINMIIAIPIWILIAWLIYILILKAIPFVGG